MTKNLLTALLIAGISATAKAEPSHYHCEVKHSPMIDFGAVENEKFKMVFDSSHRIVVIRGEVLNVALRNVEVWDDGRSFSANEDGRAFIFTNGNLYYAGLRWLFDPLWPHPVEPEGHTSECEKR